MKEARQADTRRKREARAKEKERLQADTAVVKRELKLKRLKETERKKRYKQNLKAQSQPNSVGSFKSVQSLGKATKKVKSVLPKSPSKKLAVVKKLIYEILPNKSSSIVRKIEKAPLLQELERRKTITEIVTAYYNRDDISRQAPGKRDVKTIRDSSGNNHSYGHDCQRSLRLFCQRTSRSKCKQKQVLRA